MLQHQLSQMKETDDKINKMTSDRVNSINYQEYESLLANDEVREKIVLNFKDKYKHLQKNNVDEISRTVKLADKDLFLKFKDGKYTLD